MQGLTWEQERVLRSLLSALLDQREAQVLVQPYHSDFGHWFGGGNLVQDSDGVIWMSGRYRNAGDSRTGLRAGERGLECALFRSEDGGSSFEKVVCWSKADLSQPGREVLSIEGTHLHRRADGSWELFISSEKAATYPKELAPYQKPGTGVWTIDRMEGRSVMDLDAQTLAPVLENDKLPEYLHVKDPVLFDASNGGTWMIFCSHPFCWTSSNTGLAVRRSADDPFQVQSWEVVRRGPAWDVAVTRVTGRLPVPAVGLFAELSPCAVYFYDGAECVRAHEENPLAHKRPRGFSCEEIGGAFWGREDAFPRMERLSRLEPLFVSPWGTGCSRYVKTLVDEDGILATWQQSRPDGSQPLVGHRLSRREVERILGGV